VARSMAPALGRPGEAPGDHADPDRAGSTPPSTTPSTGGWTMNNRIRNMVTAFPKGCRLPPDGHPPCPRRPPECPDRRRARPHPGALGAGAPDPAASGPAGPHRPPGGCRARQCRHRPGPANRPGMRRPLPGPVCRRAAAGAPARGRPSRAPCGPQKNCLPIQSRIECGSNSS
jgi:hypothetical protein